MAHAHGKTSTEGLACPKCGGRVIKRGSSHGKQRYYCHPCDWHGTDAVGSDERSTGIDEAVSRRNALLSTKGPRRRLVVTSAQNATPVNAPFLAALLRYCADNDARLLVIPYRYKNPTSVWSEKAQGDDWWAEELLPHLIDRRVQLNSNLMLLGDIKTQPTADSPLLGLESISGSASAIVGHPKIALSTIPTPSNKLPKLLLSTGAVTVPNYLPSKAGKKGEFHHTAGAVVAEIEGKAFHVRHVNALKDGSFCDLNWEYYPDKPRHEARIEALIMGDYHIAQASAAVTEATFGKGGMCDVLRPKRLVWHDLFDGQSINPHAADVFSRFSRRASGRESVERELTECFDFVNRHTPAGTENVIPYSNHTDFLRRFVRDTDPRSDLTNCVWLAEAFRAMCLSIKAGKELDPFEWAARRGLKCYRRTKFLKMDESYSVLGVELGMHGHAGPNGSRGSAKAFSRMGTKSVSGHSHSPAISGGAYVVGVSGNLRMGYNVGPSSWLHTHCVLYRNGKRALINVIDGAWRLSGK